MKRYSVVLALSVVLSFSLLVSADSEYATGLIDQSGVTDAENALGAPDSSYAVIGEGYLTLDMGIVVGSAVDGAITVWYTGSCDVAALDDFEDIVYGYYSLPVDGSPHTEPFTPSADAHYFKALSGCSIDAVLFSDAPPPTPTPTSTPAATPTITPGVSGADIVGYLGIFHGQEYIIALFFALGILGFIFSVVRRLLPR